MAVQVAELYDAEYYRVLAERHLDRNAFARNRVRNVLALANPRAGERVLDIGCGMGTFAVEATLRGACAIGIDPAPAALVAAGEIAERLGAGDARFIAADGADLPIASDSVDLVICADLTEHLDDTTLLALLGESERVLAPGGRLAVYTPSPTHVFERLMARGWLLRHDPTHIGLRTMTVLVNTIERTGLRVTRLYHRPSHVPLFRSVERLLAGFPVFGGLFRRRVCILATKP